MDADLHTRSEAVRTADRAHLTRSDTVRGVRDGRLAADAYVTPTAREIADAIVRFIVTGLRG
jgi:hypothetical protein